MEPEERDLFLQRCLQIMEEEGMARGTQKNVLLYHFKRHFIGDGWMVLQESVDHPLPFLMMRCVQDNMALLLKVCKNETSWDFF